MSRDEMNEMEQLDTLTLELAEAGRLARVAMARSSLPESGFAARLRSELLGQVPTAAATLVMPALGATVVDVPVPPARPLNVADRLADRRAGNRPFAGTERRAWDAPPGVVAQDGLASMPRAGRRWGQPVTADAGAALDGYALPLDQSLESDGAPVPLKPSVRWHLPAAAMPSRWVAIGLAASVAIASVTYTSGIFTSPRFAATATGAQSAALIRGGIPSALTAGVELREGDEIRVAPAGEATLALGGSYVRMAGGSDLKLGSFNPSHVAVNQIAGRVYHRVSVQPGGDYQVATATVIWKATGTAFDLDRETTSSGGEQVHGMALYDGLDVQGPGLRQSLSEGSGATVVLRPDGSPAGSLAIAPIGTLALNDAWLVENADLDSRLGLPLGRLAALISPEPRTPSTAVPAVSTPAPAATPQPTTKPTPKPAAKPTPKPTPAGPPDLGALKITHNGDSSYTFSWPKYTGSGFSYYKLVYENGTKTPSYPASPYWACNSSAADNTWTGFIDPGSYSVRLQVVDEPGGKVIIRAQTKVVRLTVSTVPPTQSLGGLSWADNGDGTFSFSWTRYSGYPFSYYKMVFETASSGKNPSYPGGSDYWAVPGTSDSHLTMTVGANNGGSQPFEPGDYKVRIQAIGYPAGSAYAYAQTTVLNLTVP
jgi:hypothetical protein